MNLIKKIYTCTFNPAIDHFIQLDKINNKEVNRSKHNEMMANGKGINVSYVLNDLGAKTTALGFNGGFSGKYIVETLDSLNIKNDFVQVDEPTRINVFLNTGDENIKIVNGGFNVKEKQIDEMIKKIENIEPNSLIVFSGSIPKGAEGLLIKAAKICNDRKIHFICDTSHKDLKEILKYKPLLIKPNDEELEEIFNFKINNKSDVIEAGNKLKKLGAQNVAITLGEKGSYLF
jgi:1-phosphofructokinase family hexose kinase